jgi:hypothetical protein
MIATVVLLLREWAKVAISREIASRTRQASRTGMLFGLIAMLGLASLTFFYIFAFEWLAAALDEVEAAAILCGANLLLIALILGFRAVAAARRRRTAERAPSAELQALLEIGLGLEQRLREKAPAVALAAIIVGFAIGARPELLDILKPSRESEGAARDDRN